ncbi:MAG: hypothetical protein AMJ79_01045 [Phycisphaerae bacterium SM23_30]|nr:MAG: hypothetical protein AMJ79_01045 [Phycisphaerae bacterium SM23_30]
MGLEFLADLADPARLIGPIFDKELRVSSRRRRYYLLRFAYIAGLSIAVLWVWMSFSMVPGGLSPAGRILRLSEAGKVMITSVVWFQFCAAQFLAVTMLSSSISDEIYRRTLGVLMTTPMSSFQIVTGKLFSRLLQIMILLAISLPLLAIVRVFGGVPWDYLISSLCITLTAVVFAGSLSLYYSIRKHQAFLAMRQAFSVCLLLYLLPPIAELLLALLYPNFYWGYFWILHYLNPFYILAQNTQMMMTAAGAASSFLSWPLHCGIMMSLSVLVLARSMRSVRKVALKDAAGQLQLFRKGKRISIGKAAVPAAPPKKAGGKVKPVTGPPILWKEMRTPLIKQEKIFQILALIFVAVALLAAYGFGIYYRYLDEEYMHVVYIVVYLLFGMARTTAVAAGTISSEKEARTWPLLLTTPLEDRQIAWGKMIGAILQGSPAWLLIAGHMLVFCLVGYIHPIAIIHVSMVVVPGAFFAAALGLYLSSSFKRTSTAVTAATLLLSGLWLFFPWCCCGVFIPSLGGIELIFMANPFFAAGMTVAATAGTKNADLALSQMRYGFDGNDLGILAATAMLLFIGLLYLFFAFLLASGAMDKFRSNIFSTDK